jgi:hypothetical protein
MCQLKHDAILELEMDKESTSKNLKSLVSLAEKKIFGGDHKNASIYFNKAANIARKELNKLDLYHIFLHYSYIEKLRLETGRDETLIDKIIENLNQIINVSDDDRFEDKLSPYIRYFTTLKCCLVSDYKKMQKEIINIHKITDKSPHYIDSLSHVICESLQILECIDAYDASNVLDNNDIEKRRKELIKCIENRIKHVHLPGKIKKYFEGFERCLKNVDISGLNIELCLRKFNDLYTNPQDEMLYFVREALADSIESFVAHYEREKNMKMDIKRIVSVSKSDINFELLRRKFGNGNSLEDEYFSILDSIAGIGRHIERSPDPFKNMKEEDLRHFILASLNANYKGKATGETFNKSGKTDILVRVNDENIFIGECKFWWGQKSFLNAIDQLFGYTTSKDTRLALIIFNKKKNIKKILQKIDQIIEKQKNFKRKIEESTKSKLLYVFEHPIYNEIDIILGVLLFNMY